MTLTYFLTRVLFLIAGIYGIALVKYEYITVKWQQVAVFFPSIFAVAISFAHILRGERLPIDEEEKKE